VSFLGVFLSILVIVQVVLAPFLGLTLVPNKLTPPSRSTLSAFSTILAKTTTLASSSALPFASQIECHYCHSKGHVDSRYPQCASVIDCEDDSLLGDVDELLVIHPLELDYNEDPSVMYQDDSPLDEDYLLVMRCTTDNDSDSWKCTSIFHTFISINGKPCKLVIDGRSSINVIFKSDIDKDKATSSSI